MNMFRRLTPLGLLLAGGCALVAQESTGTLRGVVLGPDGKPLSNVTIKLTSPVLLRERVTTTDAKGEYRFSLLPPSNYRAVFSKADYVGGAADFAISLGTILKQDMKLRAIPKDTQGAVVEVVAASASVDKTQTSTATNFSGEQMQSLPTGSLNAYGALFISPSVQGSTSYPSIRGGIAGQSQVLVNGISTRDPLVRQVRQSENVLDDLTQDIQVMQSPMNAKYGFTSSGLISMVTKQGTNNFQGSVRVKLTAPNWDGGTHETEWRNNVIPSGQYAQKSSYSTPDNDDLGRTYEVTLLGPLVKDHLTFSYGGRRYPNSTTQASIPNIFSDNRASAPKVGGTTGLQAGDAFGNTSAATNIYLRNADTEKFDQFKIFWLISADQTLELNYSRNTYNSLSSLASRSYAVLDPNVNQIQTGSKTGRGLAYKGVFGNTIVSANYGDNKSLVAFPTGPLDPVLAIYHRDTSKGLFETSSSRVRLYNVQGAEGDGRNELRRVSTANLDFQTLLGSHNLEYGAQQLKEENYAPGYNGMNRRVWFAPGRLANGNYVVYNYAGSAYADPSKNTSSTAGWRVDGRVPEMRLFLTPYSDESTVATTTSAYVNDTWTVNDHWIVMAGLRADQAKFHDREGERIKTTTFSPRAMVKFDVNGDNKHVFMLNSGVSYGTIGEGSLSNSYARRPNAASARYFWNKGTNAAMEVTPAEFQNPANYSLFTVTNNDYATKIDPNLKPEYRISLNLEYKRAFESGGYFRITLVNDTMKDLWYQKGDAAMRDLKIPGFDSSAAAFQGYTYQRTLTFDPNGKRNYRAVEVEWDAPLYRGNRYQVNYGGNMTVSRTKATSQIREGNVGIGNIQFYDVYEAAGWNRDAYNPYGDYDGYSHMKANAWLTFKTGERGGITNELSLLMKYSQGNALSLVGTYEVPQALKDANAAKPLGGLRTSQSLFYNQARGQFSWQDGAPVVNLQWNVTVPVYKQVTFFTAMTVTNVFNWVRRGDYDIDNSSYTHMYTQSSGAPRTYTPGQQLTYQMWAGSGPYYVNPFSGERSFTLDMGFRF